MNVALAPQRPVALDPITVEVIGAALSSIVEETGEALIRASYSTNIKERRDCSVGLFDEANVPLQFPAMLTGVPPEADPPPDPDDGSMVVPPHADRHNAAQTKNARRTTRPPRKKSRNRSGDMIVSRGRGRVNDED